MSNSVHEHYADELKRHAILALCDLAPPGTTVYTVRRRTSRSGASIAADFYVISCATGHAKPTCITALIAQALGMRTDKSGAVTFKADEFSAYQIIQQLSRLMHGMTDKPRGAIAPHGGVPCKTSPDVATHAGYTLRSEWI